MNRNKIPNRLMVVGLLWLVTGQAQANVTDFTTWTLVEDPADPDFGASVTSTLATVTAADGPVGSGTDIGFQSVDGATPAGSNFGFAFDPSSSFELAIDFDLSFTGSPSGLLGLGFGIGEDSDGTNSAGVAILTNNGSVFGPFGGASRINDVDQAPLVLSTGASLSGTFFVGYDAVTGDVTVGASQTPSASTPDAVGTFAGIQNQWGGGDLLASFFLRSQDLPLPGFDPWQGGGTAEAVFSNLRVLNGDPKSVGVIPEPATIALAVPGLIALGAWTRLGRRRG